MNLYNEVDKRVLNPEILNSTYSLTSKKIGFLLFRIFLLLAVLGVVWLPELLHYKIDRNLVSTETVAQSLRTPESEVLDEVVRMNYSVSTNRVGKTPSEDAEAIVSGWFHAQNLLDAPIKLQGYPSDFMTGPPTFQLATASMSVERTLLDAFEETNDDRFLQLAITRSLALASYEEAQHFGNGFLWNDHAIASRITVLTALWRHMREKKDIPIESSRAILSFVARSGRLLAKPSHFTVRTNHGVMQNIALLQIGAAFPALPEAAHWRQLAIDRLKIQLQFYVSKEGFVLEHSAGYHIFGTELISMAIRLSLLNGMPVDQALADANQKTRSVVANIVRPDGSLPAFGNTNVTSLYGAVGQGNIQELKAALPFDKRREPMSSKLYPLSGYAVWSLPDTDKPAQTVIVWAKHDGHGHKHADELSVLFWSGGVNWLTSTGYWPYGDRNTESSYSWNASNAPHEVGEQSNSSRTIKLLSTGEAEASDLRMIDIERSNAGGAQFRRQVIQLDKNILVVLDFSHNVSTGTETIWTIDPSLRLAASSSGSDFLSNVSPENRRINISVTSQSNSLSLHRGAVEPFAGWVVLEGRPTPTDAIRVVKSGSEGATASVFRVTSSDKTVSQSIKLESGATPENWSLSIEAQHVSMQVTRNAAKVSARTVAANTGDNKPTTLTLTAPSNLEPQVRELKQAFMEAINAYPQWQDWFSYRVKLSYLIIALALLVESIIVAIRLFGKANIERYQFSVHVIIGLGWAGVASWAELVYFR